MKIEITKEQRQTYARLLQNMDTWAELMAKGGPSQAFLDIRGEEYCYFNMLDGMDTLTPTQRWALHLIYIEDRRDGDAAVIMGTPNAPVRQYADRAVEKLCYFKVCADNDLPLPKIKSTPVSRKII